MISNIINIQFQKMYSESTTTSIVSSAYSSDYTLYAPIQRPLETTEDLPELDLGYSDSSTSISSIENCSERKNSSKECFSILAFLQKRVTGARNRICSQELRQLRVLNLRRQDSENGRRF